MKKVILSLMLLFATMSANADAVTAKMRIVSDKEVAELAVKNSSKFGHRSDLKVSFIFSKDDVINFDVYEKFVENDKIYLLGRSRDLNMIIIDRKENNVNVPLGPGRRLMIESKKIANQIIEMTNSIPENSNGLKNI